LKIETTPIPVAIANYNFDSIAAGTNSYNGVSTLGAWTPTFGPGASMFICNGSTPMVGSSPPNGNNYICLQIGSSGSTSTITQSIYVMSGSRSISFYISCRSGYYSGGTVTATINEATTGAMVVPGENAWYLKTLPFTIANAGYYILTFTFYVASQTRNANNINLGPITIA
jgi:hypothetical protein